MLARTVAAFAPFVGRLLKFLNFGKNMKRFYVVVLSIKKDERNRNYSDNYVLCC